MHFVLAQSYPLPAQFPGVSQLANIDPVFINVPFIQDAVKTVNAQVDASILSIPPSVYNPLTPNQPRYVADPVQHCYFAGTTPKCGVSKKPSIKPDIVTCPTQNHWGLSYDDGPNANIVNGQNVDDSVTVQRTLDQHNIKATLFVVGINVLWYPDLVKRAFDAGHEIALHTWTHHPLTSLSNEQIVAEIKYNEAIIYKTIGVIPRLFRPPYGDIDDRVRAIVQALGYQMVTWTLNPVRDSMDSDQPDFSNTSFTTVMNNIAGWYQQGAQPGFISLQHNLNNFSSRIASQAIDAFVQSKSPLQPMAISTCLNQTFYRDWKTPTSTTKANAPTPTATVQSSSAIKSVPFYLLLLKSF
ncbi:hypothetical protein EDD86DRAFT_211442 [Gorgonomyces haynaldii]|nr:hypothetical protein EDD86DRAFT_211442 [Gorgonomyces haynaldii]